MEVICVEEKSFMALFDKVIDHIQGSAGQVPDKWISDKDAMKMLNITSATTLQKFRDEGSIRFSQPSRKIILYDRDSINDFLEKHAKDTF